MRSVCYHEPIIVVTAPVAERDRVTAPSRTTTASGCIDFSYDAYTSPNIYESETLSNVASPCHSARHEARPSKLRTLEQQAAPRLPERSPIIYIPDKNPMNENVMLLNVASSLSQRPSRSATKQLRPLEQRATSRLPETLPY